MLNLKRQKKKHTHTQSPAAHVFSLFHLLGNLHGIAFLADGLRHGSVPPSFVLAKFPEKDWQILPGKSCWAIGSCEEIQRSSSVIDLGVYVYIYICIHIYICTYTI